jgi:acetylglutamate kinase
MRTVVKIGGAWLSVGPSRAELESLARMPGEVIVVHGGGAEISRWSERLDLAVEWADGLRVTRGETVQLTSMVLSGWMNKRLSSSLATAGRPSIGLSGEDGPLLRARLLDEDRYGRVGEISDVDPAPLQALLGGGFTPVVSPLARGEDGDPVNVNADEAAVGLARAMGADRLLLVSDVPGVLIDGEVLDHLDADRASEMESAGVIVGGMAVKVGRALSAAEAGIDVRIGSGGLLTGGAGTRILAPALVGAGRRGVA